MSLLESRRNVMAATDPRTIYLARDLVCDGATFYDTGFAPFSSENIDKDFKITIRLSSFTANVVQGVILGCKYEGTLGGQSYPGIYIRRQNSNANIEFGGYNYPYYAITTLLNKNLYIWRTSGSYYGQLEGDAVKTLSVRSTTFNQNIVIGAGVQTNGTKFRYSTCVIDYIRIEWPYTEVSNG